MSNGRISPPPSSVGLEKNRLSRFGEKPSDFSESQWAIAKETAVKIGACMPQQMADSAFYFYYMGASWDEIADKLNTPVGMVLYTAVHYSWEKKKALMGSVRAGEKVKRADAALIDMITDSIVATAAVYKTQLSMVAQDPSNADKCALIPKNFKELKLLMEMLESLQSVDGSRGRGSSVNVNIANVSNGESKKVTSSTIDAELLEEPTEEERNEILQLLNKQKEREK